MLRGLRHVARLVFGRLLPKRAYPVLIGPLRGSRIILGSLAGEGGGASVYFGLVEREQTRWVSENLKENERFFDIGANVGYYTLLASRLVGSDGSVVAVEPYDRNLSLLRSHVKINGLVNASILPMAIADKKGVEFFSTGDSTATGALSPQGTIAVDVMTLDDLAERVGIPDMIKIDVEGAEERVLLGGAKTLAKRPKILLSTHSDALRTNGLSMLAAYGYVCRPLDGDDRAYEFFCE